MAKSSHRQLQIVQQMTVGMDNLYMCRMHGILVQDPPRNVVNKSLASAQPREQDSMMQEHSGMALCRKVEQICDTDLWCRNLAQSV